MPFNYPQANLEDNTQLHDGQLLASIDGIFWEADLHTFQFTYVSEQAERLLGYPAAQWLTADFWVEHMHPDDREWAPGFCALAVSEQRNHSFEYRMIGADGRIVWLHDVVSVVRAGAQATKLRGIMIDITQQKQAEEARKSYLWFLESMDKINRAIQGTNDLEQLLRDVLDTVLAIFDCDRAGLLCTREPNTVAWSTAKKQIWAMDQRLLDVGVPLLSYPEMVELLQILTTVDRPVTFGQGADYPLPPPTTAHFSVQAAITMVVYPKGDVPYLFGLHQCAYPRVWTAQEQQLFQEIGRRLGDALTGLLAYRRLQENELRYREVFENTSDAIVIAAVTAEGHFRLLDFNPAWSAIMGIDATPLIGQCLEDFSSNEIARATLAHYRACLQSKAPLQYEDCIVTPTGQWYMQNNIVPIVDATGKVYRVVDVGRNVTEQKRFEAELRSSEARFRTFVDHASDAFFLHGEGGKILDLNRQAAEYLGYTREELIGMMPTAFDANLTDTNLTQLQGRIDNGEVLTFEARHRHKNGTILPVEVSIRSFQVDGQLFSVSLTRDIAERKRVQEELTLFRSLLDHTGDIIEVIDPQTSRFLDVNEQACVLHGYTRDEYLTLTAGDINPEVALLSWAEIITKLQEYGSCIFESQHRRKDGSIFPVEISASYIQLDRDYLLTVVRDISERKRTEQALVEGHNLLSAIVEGTADTVFVKDLQGRYLMINRAGAHIMGKRVEEVIGKDDFELFSPESAHLLRERDLQVMTTQQAQVFEEVETEGPLRRVYLTTKSAYRDAQGAVVGLIGISHEVTELKRLEDQLRQAQKMEALGRLAGGVAHDFNNLLTVINGYSHLILNRLQADSVNRPPLAEIQKAGERAAGLTRQLLAFSRKQVLQPQVVDINTLLTELIQLLRRLIGENIELTLVPAPTLGLAKLDPGQFEQAIINLAVNARDAMPQGGQLTLETANITFAAEYTEHHPEVTPGPYVCVTMRDSGLGMDEVTKARIFEPFFTTKGPGQGTGLGLAMVYGFVRQSDGHIEVFSKLNEGTTFKLYLPVAETQQLSVKLVPAAPSWLVGTETVLLVEDEASVRELVSDILVAHGYRVLEASEPEKGIALAANYAGPIHLLLTDVIMPQMDGRKLARHLVAVRADLKVLYMSGYTENVIVNHEIIGNEIAFIQKPFSVDGLLQKVRAVLG